MWMIIGIFFLMLLIGVPVAFGVGISSMLYLALNGKEVGRTLLMAALESPKGILNAYEICSASQRMFGVAISGSTVGKYNEIFHW